jgi:hypothetical protein
MTNIESASDARYLVREEALMSQPVFFDPKHRTASITRLGLAFSPLVGALLLLIAALSS